MSTKTVTIMRGPSGSGKSTYTSKNLPNAFVCSADLFFMKNGVYNFDAKKLGFAHEYCKDKFKKAIKDGVSEIVVDNTNTQVREMSFYFDYAKKHGYEVNIVRLHAPVAVCASRNTHGVPQDAVQRMNDRMASIPVEWNVEEKHVITHGQ